MDEAGTTSEATSTGVEATATATLLPAMGFRVTWPVNPRVASRAFNKPLMAREDLVDQVIAAARMMPGMEAPRPEAYVEVETVTAEPEPIGPHIAIVQVHGVLVQRPSYDPCMQTTSYPEIRDAIETARAAGAIGVVLDIDSGGGEVAGCFDFVDWLYALRPEFPVYAVANDWAYSAAYAIFSGARKRFVSRTGGVGSIGVIARHCDQSGFDAKEGFSYTAITSHALKDSLSPHKPLDAAGKLTLQEMVDDSARIFVATVARNTGMTPEVINGLQAGERFGQAAVDIGLADGVASLEEVAAMMIADLDAAYAAEAGGATDTEQAASAAGDRTMALKTKAIRVGANVTAPRAETVDSGDVSDASGGEDVMPQEMPKLKAGDRVRCVAPYEPMPMMGVVETVPEKPTFSYGVRMDGSAEGTPPVTYDEGELEPVTAEEHEMDQMAQAEAKRLAAQLAEVDTKLKAEQDARKAAEAKAVKQDAELVVLALRAEGVRADRLNAAVTLIGATRKPDQSATDAAASLKAETPEWFVTASAPEPIIQAATEPVTQATDAKPAIPAPSEAGSGLVKTNAVRSYGTRRVTA